MKQPSEIAPAAGKLGILLPGFGAVATTFVAGVEAIRQGIAAPIGSLTQMNTIRLGKRTDERTPLIKEFVPLVDLENLVFGAWDPIPDNGYESALVAGVLHKEKHLDPIKDFLSSIKPMPAVFSTDYVKKLEGTNVKTGATKRDLAEQLRADIRNFKKDNDCARLVMVWCGSTEIYIRPGAVHETIEAFEKGMDENDHDISPAQLYAYAAIMEGVPYANGAPNLSADFAALEQLAKDKGVPICGKDFKTGQTLMKTILAPGFKTRMLGINGW
ncbi:MAG: inositol-3-phosphate synthase, partial [Gemmatimonadetes bacterium]|nr:inositol-3-phosphate synthase [Gemmatimonadota bacterium]